MPATADRRNPQHIDRRGVARGGRRLTDPPGRHPLVLVADYHPDDCELYREFLGSLAFAVEEALDGEEAAEKARRLRPAVMVTELRLPRLDGFGLIERLHSDPATRDMPVVVLSADLRPEQIERARRTGAAAFLAKPCLPETLLETIRTALRSK